MNKKNLKKEINISDLRIGNYYYEGYDCIKLDSKKLLNILESGLPITLTAVPLVEEMLIEFGFLKIIGWDDQIYYRYFDFMILECEGYFEHEIAKLKYLHELQTLYYLLTNSELLPINYKLKHQGCKNPF